MNIDHRSIGRVPITSQAVGQCLLAALLVARSILQRL